MEELNRLRAQIDKIDEIIAKSLRKREKIVKLIKEVKKQSKVPNIDPNREAEIYKKLDTEYQKNIFVKIIEESRKMQL